MIDFLKQKSSNRSLIKTITKKIENKLPENLKNLQILVTEIQCFEPDCVPIETLIILLGEKSKYTTKILKPINEVNDNDINSLDIPLNLNEENYLENNNNKQDNNEDNKQDYSSLWINSITNIINRNKNSLKEEDYLEGLKKIQDYIQNEINSINLNINSNDNNDNNNSLLSSSIPPSPPPTIVTMKPKNQQTKINTTNINTNTNTNTSINTNNPYTIHTSNTTITTSSSSTTTTPNISTPEIINRTKRDPSLNPSPILITTKQDGLDTKPRHKKGVRQRGCPCCDPENLDNIIDKLLYFDAPP